MQEKKVHYKRSYLTAAAFILPQLIITFVFFIWPAGESVVMSFYEENPFGVGTFFVWFDNYKDLFADSDYINSFKTTLIFSFCTMLLSMSAALLLAYAADRLIKGAFAYKTFLIVPYAIAAPVAGVLWMFMFNPSSGIIASFLDSLGYTWNYMMNGNQAMLLIVIASAWNQLAYNFLFFLAGMQAIPKSLLESASIDGAGELRKFYSIVLPLLTPTVFFLIVMNITYTFFDTFGTVHAVTQGGPGTATNILVYKVFNDGFVNTELGTSSAQSVILMAVVMAITFFQFKFVEKKVNY